VQVLTEIGPLGPVGLARRASAIPHLSEKTLEQCSLVRRKQGHLLVLISDSSEAAAVANHLVGRSAGTPPRALFENLLETLWRNAPQNTWAPETLPK
jgi:hypothetical protein